MRTHALDADMISLGQAAAARHCLHFVFRLHLHIRFGDVTVFNVWSCPGLKEASGMSAKKRRHSLTINAEAGR